MIDMEDNIENKSEWIEEEGQLMQIFEFESFNEAIDFVNDVADLAEEKKHYPDILIQHNIITIMLSTDDEVTEKDKHMAEEIDKMLDEEGTN